MEDVSDFKLQGYYHHHPKGTDTMEDTLFTKFSIQNGDCFYMQIDNFKINIIAR